MIGITMCNGEPGVCSPAGTRAVIGPNPIAVGAPTRSKPVVLDMSIASIVRGRVLEYQRTRKALPEGVAIDEEGGPTVDPSAALLGAFLPFGGSQASTTSVLSIMESVPSISSHREVTSPPPTETTVTSSRREPPARCQAYGTALRRVISLR
jgi:LDH2 family malate/lactate/ureidoglycolate dehydrogenase